MTRIFFYLILNISMPAGMSLNLGTIIIKNSLFFKISITPDVHTKMFFQANIPKCNLFE